MNVKNLTLLASVLMLLGFPSLSAAQTAKPTLETYLSETVRELQNADSVSIGKWTARHPGETVETPEENYAQQWALDARQEQNRKLQGRWCTRSTVEMELDGGILGGQINVRRIAVFYPPVVEEFYGKPLPPLPTELGAALHEHGCRLVKIFSEFDLVSDPQKFIEAVAKQLPGKRFAEPGKLMEYPKKGDFWDPVYSFEISGTAPYYHHLFTRDPKIDSDSGKDEKSTFLLESEWGTLDYGSPSPKTINPAAGLPWIPLRAAMLAKLPSAPTLAMLSFVAPQVGEWNEQPPLYCERQLVPVLRTWLDLAARSTPQQHAAALLLADRVLGRLANCEEFIDPESYPSGKGDYDALEKYLKEMDIRTDTPAHLGGESYAGNLLDKVLKIAPNGVVNELGHLAILENRCQWSHDAQSADCPNIVTEGEDFLSRFPRSESTPSVHLILAEAYALTSENPEGSSATQRLDKEQLENRAEEHYRAWYAKSVNERDRALVWQEIWALDAHMGPWLMMPSEFHNGQE
jgi:hypothetical protein